MTQTTAQSAQEITMRVYVKQEGIKTAFTVGTNGKEVGHVLDFRFIDKGYDYYADCVCGDTDSYPEAVEKVSEGIAKFFAQYGINVEFVKE